MNADDASFSDALTRDMWPVLLEQIVSTSRRQIDSEVARIQQSLHAEHAQKLAVLEAKEAEIAEAWQKINDAEQKLQEQKAALEEEKRIMMRNAQMSDVLHVNIGGEKNVAVQRGTMCVIEDSMLASSFSGRWDDSLARDKDGAFFVDFPPELFMPLLSYLRLKRIEDPASPARLPNLAERQEEFSQMLRFYGLSSLVLESYTSCLVKFESKAEDIAITGSTVRRTRHPFWNRAFGDSVFHLSQLVTPIAFRIQVCCFGNMSQVKEIQGPNVGFAAATMQRYSDESASHNPKDIWVYCCGNGHLIAKKSDDVVGPAQISPSKLNDVITMILFPDGRVGSKRNDENMNIIFCGLPSSVKPLLEFNARDSMVQILE